LQIKRLTLSAKKQILKESRTPSPTEAKQMSNSTATIPAEVQELLNLAASEYDAFWASLDQRDRDLTADLTIYETYDAVFIFDNTVWSLSYNEVTEEFEVCESGPISDLAVYANSELTGLDEDQLNNFIEELAHNFKALQVKKGQSSSGGSAVEWVRDSRQVGRTWEAALNEVING
jgi:hypothetical protein